MILKMYDERTDSFMFVSDVAQVKPRYDQTFHIYESEEGMAVLEQYVNNKDNHDRKERFNPYIKEGDLDNYTLRKNTSVICPCNDYLIYRKDVYKGEDCYPFKMLEVYLKTNLNLDNFIRYLLPMKSPVYLLNEDGKTIDKI